ncbi:pilus assembly FimT family protein [Carboxydothermus pertinax]|uniref:Type IV pilin n=1 Tax=Carboxydothermus pertinax TaxID=870242 RepID=A0A1L8CVM5_9THEO|nr:prepilin-type N-terminal cleavage/methylation domain-containing protein [Carboxydothermus pertinax]GAV22960.1 type IV pilin [Carboxydothermus pertinax]
MVSKNIFLLKEKGFTLIELLVVTTIAGVTFLTAVISLDYALAKITLANEAYALAQNLRQTKEMAVAQEKAFTIWFFQDSNSYLISENSYSNKYYILPPRVKFIAVPVKLVTIDYKGSSRAFSVEMANSYGVKVRVYSTPQTDRIWITSLYK